MKGALGLARASVMVRAAMHQFRPDVVFSTGGYASAPVVYAARGMHVPYIIHEQNVVPGRTNRINARTAYAVATTFRNGSEHFECKRIERTGMPIRRELRAESQGSFDFDGRTPDGPRQIFVMGGSQGAIALNEAALATAVRMAGYGVTWLMAAGPQHYDAMLNSRDRLAVTDEFEIRAYLSAKEMGQAYFRSPLVVCRSGGSLAEVAAFRKPSVLVPYPLAFGNHQMKNAEEFAAMGAAQVLPQGDLSAATLEVRIRAWLEDDEAQAVAQQALADWDIPDTNDRVLALLSAAASE